MNTHIKLLLAGVSMAALTLLAGCHHSDDGTTTSSATGDAYTNQVSGVVAGPAAQSETAEPVVVSGLTPTTSETAQPVAVNAN